MRKKCKEKEDYRLEGEGVKRKEGEKEGAGGREGRYEVTI